MLNDSRLPPRFWSKVLNHPATGCWLWGGYTNKYGYGTFRHEKTMPLAHRVSYTALVGPIVAETLDHLCRNRACVNPAHLEPVSNLENILRGNGLAAHNAVKTHCLRGHEFTPTNTYTQIWRGRTKRSCVTCKLHAAKRTS